jgi:cytochrome P450
MGTTAQALLANRSGSDRGEKLQAELRKIEQRMLDQVEERRENPREDIISAVARMRGPDNSYLPREDILALLVNSFLFGGLVTAAKVIAAAIIILGRDLTLRRQLIDDPKLIPGFVNELVRFVTPANSVARTATRDTMIGNVLIRKGDRILVMLNAANFDPEIFACPRDVQPKRSPNKHVGFGFGAHFCPGSPLARLEIELALGELLRRMPDYQLADLSIGSNDLDGPGGWERLAIRPCG